MLKRHFFKLYTLYYTFSRYNLKDKTQYKSTDPQYISFVLPFHCSRIYDLNVDLPLQEKLWSVISSFDRLSTLSVLDRAPRLYSVTFSEKLSSYTAKLTSKSVRRLNLDLSKNYFNKPACIALCHSSLGVQCEVLLIKTNDRQNIPYLIKKMINQHNVIY